MSTIRCPACNQRFELEADTRGACPGCANELDVRLFSPVAPKVDEVAAALPDDAVCANHAGKRAEHICAGTGAYICALCAVNTGGEVVSAAFLGSAAGKRRKEEAFATRLPRPDAAAGRIFWGALLGSLIPCLSCLVIPSLLVFIPWGYILLARAAHLRREGNPIYARVVRPGALWLKGIGLTVLTLAIVAMTFALAHNWG